MAKSLGLSRVPTLDPKGEQEYPSYEYVRGLVRALNSNFEILNNAFGGSRQDATDLGTIYEATGTAISVGNSYTQVLQMTLPAGSWMIFGKGSHFDQTGNTDRDARLYDFTAGVQIEHSIDNDDRANFRATFALIKPYTSDVEFDLRLECRSGNAAGVRSVDDAVLVAYKIQEIL